MRRGGCGQPPATHCHAHFRPGAAALARLGSRDASRERQRAERPVAASRASRGRGFCTIVTLGPAYGAHKQTAGQSVHGKARMVNYRFGLRDLGVCGCVPGEGAGDRQSSQKARSRVRSGGLTVATHAWAKWMQQMAASRARGAPSSLGIRRRPLGLGEGVSEVGGGIAAFGRPGGGERRSGALPRGLGWGGEGRSLRGAGRGRGRRDCGRLIVAVGAAVAGVAGG